MVSPRLQLLLRFFVSHCHCRVQFFSSSPLSSVDHNLAEWIECGLIKSFDVSIRWKVLRQRTDFEVEVYSADCCYQSDSHKLLSTIVKDFGSITPRSLSLNAVISNSSIWRRDQPASIISIIDLWFVLSTLWKLTVQLFRSLMNCAIPARSCSYKLPETLVKFLFATNRKITFLCSADNGAGIWHCDAFIHSIFWRFKHFLGIRFWRNFRFLTNVRRPWRSTFLGSEEKRRNQRSAHQQAPERFHSANTRQSRMRDHEGERHDGRTKRFAEFLIRYQRKMIDREMIYRPLGYLSIPISEASRTMSAPVMRLNANFLSSSSACWCPVFSQLMSFINVQKYHFKWPLYSEINLWVDFII